jgi:hypothetical protein
VAHLLAMWRCVVELLLVIVSSHSALHTLSPSLLKLEVVAVLPAPSKRALALSRTLSRTLNALTAADLVSQLDFPEKNLTWQVTNFFVGGGGAKKERLVQLWEEDDGGEEEWDEDLFLSDDGTVGGKGKGGRLRVPFAPQSVALLCEFMNNGKALAIVSLVPDYGNRLLSLVSNAMDIPLLTHSPLTTVKVISMNIKY